MKKMLYVLPVLALCLVASTQLFGAKETFSRTKPHLNVYTTSNDVDMAGFSEVSGLGVETEAVEYREGNESQVIRKLPGLSKTGDVTLKRGYFGATDVEDWATEAFRGTMVRHNVSFIIVDEIGSPVRTYELIGCFPTRWNLETDAKGRVVEVVTLAFDHMAVAR